MKYYIGSTAMIDNLYFNNETQIHGVGGGAGLYAALGGKLWAEDVYLVCGIGGNFIYRFGKWCLKNKLSMEYLRRMETNTPVNNIYHFADGRKVEKRQLNEKHGRIFEYSKNDFRNQLQENCAIYVFKNLDEDFWSVLDQTKTAKILWKIALDACNKTNIEQIQKILKHVEIFSINFPYAKELFETQDKEEILERLKTFHHRIVHVASEEGQYLIQNQNILFVSNNSKELPVDNTGGDHASAAAVLVGYMEKKNFLRIGQMANHSYNMVTAQYGLPDYIQEYRNYMELRER